MRRFQQHFHRFCAFGAGLCMILVFGIIFVNSLRRYTIRKSFEWGEELPIYFTIYGVMFGIALAYLQDRHIRFTILTDFLPAYMRQRLFALVDLGVIVTGGFLAWSGYLFTQKRGLIDASGLIGTAKDYAAQTGIDGLVLLGRMGSYQASMLLGGLLLAIAALIKFEQRLRAMKGA